MNNFKTCLSDLKHFNIGFATDNKKYRRGVSKEPLQIVVKFRKISIGNINTINISVYEIFGEQSNMRMYEAFNRNEEFVIKTLKNMSAPSTIQELLRTLKQ